MLLVVGDGPVSFPEPMVVHADRLQLGDDGRHRQRHVLGHRHRLRRRQPVHGVRRRTATGIARDAREGALRAGEQEARVVADDRHIGRRRRDARARASRCGQSSSPCPRTRPIVEVLGQQWNWSYRFPGGDGVLGADRRQARQRSTIRSASIPRIRRARTTCSCRQPGAAPAARQAGQDRCCARRT